MTPMTDTEIYVTLELSEFLAMYDATVRGNEEALKEFNISEKLISEILNFFEDCPISEFVYKFICEFMDTTEAINFINKLDASIETQLWIRDILEKTKKIFISQGKVHKIV